MLNVLATKQLSNDIMAYAQSLGLKVVCDPTIKVACRQDQNFFTDDFEAFIVTSYRAIQCVLQQGLTIDDIKQKPVFALSGKTLNTLSKYGIEPKLTADHAEALAQLIIKQGATQSVLHICGNLVLPKLGQLLEQQNMAYHTHIVYDTVSIPTTKTYDDIKVVMFFSPSGIKGFLKNNGLQSEIWYVCIGQTTADYLRQQQDRLTILVADKPSPKAMLRQIKNDYDEPFKK